MPFRFNDPRDWLFEKRYGMFVHWGLYSLPAWHEQHQWRRGVPRAEYGKLRGQFNPQQFHPDQWLDLAEEAGMEFLCLTAKHHDGFCMWHSAQTDFHVGNTPYAKDIVGLTVEACRRRGFPLCLYYSVVDWHHPNYPNRNRSHELPAPEPGDKPNIEKYAAFMKEQIRELCANYGPIHGIWWDMNSAEIRDPSINDMIHAMQPAAVINDRGPGRGDFSTFERETDAPADLSAALSPFVQGCNSVGTESWGYREDEDYYSNHHLMAELDRFLAVGGGYLLNVGPKADGTIPGEAAHIVRSVGQWYRTVREAFDRTEAAPHLVENRDVLVTRKGNILYVHLAKPPISACVHLKPLDVLPVRAMLLNTGEPLEASVEFVPRYFDQEKRNFLRVRNLPVNEMAHTVMVLKLEFERLPSTDAS